MMKDKSQVFVFGEVLFDCFPTGEQVLGGAPFNVAWHLQALGNQPQFISRVGDDELGRQILSAMQRWDMDTTMLHIDPLHPTGQVDIELHDGEPNYTITPDCAYDFIARDDISLLSDSGILYHGTLGIRHSVSRSTLLQLQQTADMAIFLDVNLRSPWWRLDEVLACLQQARWVKLNEHELKQLGFSAADLRQAMAELQHQFQPELLIVTRGEQGALVRTMDGDFHSVRPKTATAVVDCVGAGDAFSAVFIHGLMANWPVAEILTEAQRFAGQVVGLRGALSTDPGFYQAFIR